MASGNERNRMDRSAGQPGFATGMLNLTLTNIAHPVERQRGQFSASTRSASNARSLMPSISPQPQTTIMEAMRYGSTCALASAPR